MLHILRDFRAKIEREVAVRLKRKFRLHSQGKYIGLGLTYFATINNLLMKSTMLEYRNVEILYNQLDRPHSNSPKTH